MSKYVVDMEEKLPQGKGKGKGWDSYHLTHLYLRTSVKDWASEIFDKNIGLFYTISAVKMFLKYPKTWGLMFL